VSYLLDTNIIIGFLKNDLRIVSRLAPMDEMVITIISVGEMLYGAQVSAQKQENNNRDMSFFRTCLILPIDERVALEYAHVRSRLKSMGKPIPENDLWIAATARAYNRTLVTRDAHLLALQHTIDVQEW